MYTINGKDYTEFDINKRCAEIMCITTDHDTGISKYEHSPNGFLVVGEKVYYPYDPVNDIKNAEPIIDKVWNELMKLVNKHGDEPKTKNGIFWTRWQHLQEMHNYTKLKAACICLIECNGGE